jgi:hypothetical protein
VDGGAAEVAYQVAGQGPPDVIYVPGSGSLDQRSEDQVFAAFPGRLASF